MKMSKGKKRFLIAGTALLLAGATIAATVARDTTEVQALTKVLKGMEDYTNDGGEVRILEIVPTDETWPTSSSGTITYEVEVEDWEHYVWPNPVPIKIETRTETKNKDMSSYAPDGINKLAEIGYFLPLMRKDNKGTPTSSTDQGGAPNNATDVSYGGVHGQPMTLFTVNSDDAFTSHIYNLYQYGMIKTEGLDNGWTSATGVGEYPIYCRTTFFSKVRQSESGLVTPLKNRLVLGYYIWNKDGTGKYDLNPAYCFDATDGGTRTIYYVSENGLPPKYEVDSLSANNVTKGPVAVKPGMQLPVDAADGTQIITRNENGTGNLDFVDAQNMVTGLKYYYGDAQIFGDTLYYTDGYHTNGDKVQFRNSDWWDEYVLGNAANYQNKDVNSIYTVKAANQVTKDELANYDLIYISGTDSAFKTAGTDISNDVLLALYNEEINNHKAIMMDALVYNEDLATNISKLALLLWQDDQSTIYEDYLNIADDGTSSHEWFDLVYDTTDTKKIVEHSLKADALTTGWGTLSAAAKENMIPIATGGGNFVTGNTYVYNHQMVNFVRPKSLVDAFDNFANGDFITPYTNEVISQGLSAVSSYIETSNLTEIGDPTPNIVNPAVCIQYILVSDGSPLANLKPSLSILEIEPVPAYLYNMGRGSDDYFALLNYKSNNNKKAEYVLENREKFVTDYLAGYYSEKNESNELKRLQYISFTSMTIAEFNARSEDLVETYDIIYIGDETHRVLSNLNGTPKLNGNNLQWENLYYYDKAHYATGAGYRNQQSWVWTENAVTGRGKYELKNYKDVKGTELPYYNDHAMIGNIYYCIGDVTRMYTSQNGATSAGWLNTENAGALMNHTDVIEVRYDSRDITKNKLEKLKEFVDSKALVLVAEDLMGTQQPVDSSGTVIGTTDINPTIVAGQTDWERYDVYGRVDTSSNLYEFLSYGLGKTFNSTTGEYELTDTTAKTNVVAISDIKQKLIDKEDLAVYVSTYKLELNITKSPTEYSYEVNSKYGYTTKDYYLQPDKNGKRYLEFEFTITADSELMDDDFRVSLYVDINKDGKFSKTQEKVQDVTIVNASNGQQADRNDDNSYKLLAGNKYVLRRNIADSYNGLINWKLDVQSTKVGYLHDSHIGYTLVKPYGYKDTVDETGKKKNRKPINILQITTNADNHLDMEGALYDYRINGNAGADNNLWGMYLDNVLDYELYIRTVRVQDFEKYYSTFIQNGGDPDDFLRLFYVQYTGMDTNGRATSPYPTEFPKNHTTPGTKGAGQTSGVAVNGDTMKNKGQRNRQGVDMIVCGFGDSISAFTNTGALGTIEKFMNDGHPVLTTHDFLIFRMSTHMQTRVLRDYFGEDKYGVSTNIGAGNYPYTPAWNLSTSANASDRRTDGLGYLHSGIPYYRGSAEVTAIEGGGKEVAYQPNTMRGTLIPQTHGLSNFVIDRFRDQMGDSGKAAYSWMNASPVELGATKKNNNTENVANNDAFLEYEVNKINEGQITTYPYYIPDSFKTTNSHGQWFTLDMTSDKDQDGESDVVVWYALGQTDQTAKGKNLFSDSIGGSVDPANGFYIYNDGNITYTGAGHENLQSTKMKEEVQLFINTLIAAYNTGISAPSAGFFEQPYYDASPITSIVVPYDKNVTQVTNAAGRVLSDSSILKKSNAANADYKYKFVDPNVDTSVTAATDGTLVYYRVEDENFVRGSKEVLINYYIEVQEKDIVKVGNKDYFNYPGLGNLEVINLEVEKDNVIKVIDLTEVLNTYKVRGNYSLETEKLKNYKKYKKAGSDRDIIELRGVEPGTTYGIYLPMSLLNNNAKFNLILGAKTQITSVATGGGINAQETDPVYETLAIVKADLLDLD